LQNPNQINRDNLQNLRRETGRIFRNKKREYLKGKVNELETNNKNKNIRDLYRGINEFKKRYVCMYVRTYNYQPEGWLDPHTVLAKLMSLKLIIKTKTLEICTEV
jgi:hypothetical protein